ncbi:GCN5-related N-acetyltransferase [Methylobacterium nodulans ORS 2060]|uniref:GCN5-related N-acetyltransferase n=2 Tax=Methylobacterium nodulans TaxID=114616 RepID=B8IMZ3_METNO|nr:GCN5-related N-acetyltransferase [Methylobacterium nodulans ORS 2060]
MHGAQWRRLEASDLAAINSIADIVHANYPEDEAILLERLALYPDGCFILARENNPVGYIISHPWQFGQPPELNSLLNSIPDPATTYFIHDIALLPIARGTGAASAMIPNLMRHAATARLPNVSLVAVNNSMEFWERHGFRVFEDPSLGTKLSSYDEDARFMFRSVPA